MANEQLILDQLPHQYEWLSNETEIPLIREFLKIYGTVESPGAVDNPVILGWAQELNLKQYTHDAIAWCGLEMGLIVKRSGFIPTKDPLWALNWANFGIKIPKAEAKLGDILTFKRLGGGHVALYIGEDNETYHIGGGNQGDKSSITRINKARLFGVNRPNYTQIPTNIRKVYLNSQGPISQNEA